MNFRLLIFLVTASGVFAADSVRHPHEEGLTGLVTIDYDGSRFRTNAMHLGTEIEWGGKENWLSLSLDTYTDFSSAWRLRGDGFATLEFGHAFYRNNETRTYVNGTLQLDAHSVLSTHGGDITPEINIAKGITEDFWIGGNVGGVFATAPDEGNRRGYGYVTLWTTYLCGWLPNESDSINLSIWAATNEEYDVDKALFISVEYEFDITDSLEGSIGLGTDPSTPWEKQGLYAMAGLIWRF